MAGAVYDVSMVISPFLGGVIVSDMDGCSIYGLTHCGLATP